MLHVVLLVVGGLVSLAGCAIVLVDVLFTRKTDCCQDETPAEYIGKEEDDGTEANRRSGFFVLAVPEFKYSYGGRRYEGKSANLFFHLYLAKGRLAVPFIDGKTYLVYVNPANPAMFVTSGEQRVAFLHVVGCAVVLLGAVLLLLAMRLPGF